MKSLLRPVLVAIPATRFHGEVTLFINLSNQNLAFITVTSSLLIAGLACARADVPLQVVVDPGGLPRETPSPTISATQTSNIPFTEPSTSTSTPSEPEPVVSPTFPPTPTILATEEVETILYETLPGDTLRTVAVRFGVIPQDISSPEELPNEQDYLNPGILLLIPSRLSSVGPNERLIPDSELVFSPHATDFDVTAFAAEKGGYLTIYKEYIGTDWLSGPEVVALVARDNSVNPRLLLALLEYQSGWVTDPTAPSGDAFNYPMGYIDERAPALFRQLSWSANELGNGYYGWRSGRLTELNLADGTRVRIAPDLNAGTIGLQYYFALSAARSEWNAVLSSYGFLNTYTAFFGDPWVYQHPLYEQDVEQPELILPFLRGQVWSFTGGPHGSWEKESAWAALDFAPSMTEPGCVETEVWAVAAAAGIIVRSGDGVVVLDMDGDGREQSGWALLYLHIASESRIELGTYVEPGDLIGHPSCEGGIATGTHIHIARKYNGEWVLADGPLAFNLSGWVAVAGSQPYQGALIKDDEVVLACVCATRETLIQR